MPLTPEVNAGALGLLSSPRVPQDSTCSGYISTEHEEMSSYRKMKRGFQRDRVSIYGQPMTLRKQAGLTSTNDIIT